MIVGEPPATFVTAGGGSEADLAHAESVLRFHVPSDLRAFLLETGGGTGWIGEGYAVLWGPRELIDFHERSLADEFFPGLVLIGSNGGGEAFAVERSTRRYVQTPFIGDEPGVRIDAGATLADLFAFIERSS